MGMQPTLWSVNALATELEIDRRTVAKRLRDVPPAGEKAGHPVWLLADALPALMAPGRGRRRAADTAEAPLRAAGLVVMGSLGRGNSLKGRNSAARHASLC